MRTGTVVTPIQTATVWEHPVAWSRDGEYQLVAWNENPATAHAELRFWSRSKRTLTPYVKANGIVWEGAFSPDGRYVAYSSTETGRFEVFVTTFPEPRQTWPVTTDGARVLSWRDDGRELLVATLTGHIAAIPVQTTVTQFSAGQPQILLRNVGFDAPFARPTRDHSRIVVRVPRDADKDRGEIGLLFGWADGLRNR